MEEEISVEEIEDAIRKATIANEITPVMCGTALRNKGVQAMLDNVIKFMPSPLDVAAVTGTDVKTDEPTVCPPSPDEPFAALAFKIMTDPFVGKLTFFRVYSGTLEAGSYILNSTTGKKERISRIVEMHANTKKDLQIVRAGDIAAAVGVKEVRTGDTFCSLEKPVILEQMTFPEPVIKLAVEPKSKADADKLTTGLVKLAEEDPTFKVNTDDETGQTIIAGMGELHLEIIVDRLKREFKVEANVGKPMVSYREAITASTTHRELYKKQSGGRGKFADISFELMPAQETTTGIEFINEIVGGSIPKEFINPVQKGFEEAMKMGIRAGYPVEGIRVRLFDGSIHEVDSDQLSFELCAKLGFKEAARKCKPAILEPIMKVEVTTPEDYTGDVVGDLNRRRGMIERMDTNPDASIIVAKVPLSEMFGYSTDLRSQSQGRAVYSMEFAEYVPVPESMATQIIENKL